MNKVLHDVCLTFWYYADNDNILILQPVTEIYLNYWVFFVLSTLSNSTSLYTYIYVYYN